MSEDNNDSSINNFIWASIAIAVIILIYGLVVFFTFKQKWASSAPFGDSFGAINALFAGLAFAGIIYTITAQQREMKLQRKAMELQRQELQQTRQEFHTTRITNVIYNQIERIDSILAHQSFILWDKKTSYLGLDGVMRINNEAETGLLADLEKEEGLASLVCKNNISFLQIYKVIDQSTKVVNRSLNEIRTTKTTDEQSNTDTLILITNLKEIYVINLGEIIKNNIQILNDSIPICLERIQFNTIKRSDLLNYKNKTFLKDLQKLTLATNSLIQETTIKS